MFSKPSLIYQFMWPQTFSVELPILNKAPQSIVKDSHAWINRFGDEERVISIWLKVDSFVLFLTNFLVQNWFLQIHYIRLYTSTKNCLCLFLQGCGFMQPEVIHLHLTLPGTWSVLDWIRHVTYLTLSEKRKEGTSSLYSVYGMRLLWNQVWM